MANENPIDPKLTERFLKKLTDAGLDEEVIAATIHHTDFRMLRQILTNLREQAPKESTLEMAEKIMGRNYIRPLTITAFLGPISDQLNGFTEKHTAPFSAGTLEKYRDTHMLLCVPSDITIERIVSLAPVFFCMSRNLLESPLITPVSAASQASESGPTWHLISRTFLPGSRMGYVDSDLSRALEQGHQPASARAVMIAMLLSIVRGDDKFFKEDKPTGRTGTTIGDSNVTLCVSQGGGRIEFFPYNSSFDSRSDAGLVIEVIPERI